MEVDQRLTLDVVIVNWNTGSYLRECLESVAATRQSVFELGEVVVVDNASTDGSLDELGSPALPLQIVRNIENRGFAAACNQGAREGDADLLLFLNPDTRLNPETLDRSVAFMADPENSKIGIAGVKMVGEDGDGRVSCSRFPTLLMFFTMMTGLSHAFPKRFPTQRLAVEELNRSGAVDQVIGAFFLVRRSLFQTLEGFDERFFVYMEEVDFAYRARTLGYASHFLADVAVYHKEGVSSEQVLGRRLFYLLRSRSEYARKHWPGWQGSLLPMLIVLIELPARATTAVFRGRGREAQQVGLAAGLYLRYVGQRLASRGSP